jgi:hypothetical protein
MTDGIVAPSIGEDRINPREQCPACKAHPRVLGPDDFPPGSKPGIEQAYRSGAMLYGCDVCGKRWAVMRETKDAPSRPRGPNRKARRAQAALARRSA